MTIRAPFVYVGSTKIVPPTASTSPRHTASPRPVPSPTSFVVTNGSKTRSREILGDPRPGVVNLDAGAPRPRPFGRGA